MKISATNIAGFIKKPSTRMILLYGPDAGQIKDLANTLTKNAAGALSDPFNIAEITKTKLSESPSAFADEAAAMSMMGGQRVVRVMDADDWFAKTLADYLEDPIGDALIVIESTDLTPSSSLRKLAESSDAVAAIPCYIDEGRSLADVIDETLRTGGFKLDPPARQYLVSALGGDRMVVKGEIEKLMLYMGDQKNITLADVEAAIGNSAEIKTEEAVYAAADQNVALLAKTLDKLSADDVQPVALLRSALYHFQKLLSVRMSMASGLSMADAIQQLRPPVFFKLKPRFENHVRKWDRAPIERVLSSLMEAEAMVKQTNIPAETVAQQTLLRVAGNIF